MVLSPILFLLGVILLYAKWDKAVDREMINGKKQESWQPEGSKGFEIWRKGKPLDKGKMKPANQYGSR